MLLILSFRVRSRMLFRHTFSIILLLNFISLKSNAQGWANYVNVSEKALELFKKKNYLASAHLYSQLRNYKIELTQFKMLNIKQDIFTSSLAWIKADRKDSALSVLNYLVDKLGYSNVKKLQTDSNFTSLYNDSNWLVLLKKAEINNNEKLRKRNQYLIAELDSILINDQKYRSIITKMERSPNNDSSKLVDLYTEMRISDSLNLLRIEAILDTYGWPSPELIEDRGEVIFLVLQHSPLATQEKYLPLVINSAKKLETDAQYIAYLTDRINLSKGKKQIYGTQLGFDPLSGKPFVEPIQDPFKVDKLRMQVDLPPIAEYLSNFNIKWDPSQNK